MSAGPPPVCRFLRSRSAYGRTPEELAGVAGPSLLEGYWCLVTMEPAGPDDALAEARSCVPGRACFAARPEVQGDSGERA